MKKLLSSPYPHSFLHLNNKKFAFKFCLIGFAFFLLPLIFPYKAHAQSLQNIQVPVGAKNIIAAQYKFSPEFEDVHIIKIRFLNTEPSSNIAISSASLYEGDKRVSTTSMNGDYAEFENIDVYIDRRAEKTLTLVLNINDRRDISGEAPSFKFNDPADWTIGGDIEVIGGTSGSKTSNYLSTTNIVIRRLNIYDTLLTLSLDPNTPYGFQGVANSDDHELFDFVIGAAANPNASAPRAVQLKSIILTFAGDAQVSNLRLYGPSNNYTDPFAQSMLTHSGGTTYITFDFSGPDAQIDYGTSKKFRLRGNVTAVTDNNTPSRSVRVSISNFGTPTTAGDVIWYENGPTNQNPDSQLVSWLYDPQGINELKPPYPLSFGSFAPPGTPMSSSPISPVTIPDISYIQMQVSEEDEVIVNTPPPTDPSQSFIVPTFDDPILTDLSQINNPFPDTNLTSLEGMAAFELHRRAVVQGFPDGSFGGSQLVNRAQSAKMLLNARYGEIPDKANNNRFPDVISGEWYVRYVVEAAGRNIISGYPDGLFRPDQTVNTAEFLKMLAQTFSLELNVSHPYRDVQSTDWFAVYAGIADKYDLFPKRRSFLIPARELTRDEVAVAIYQYLKNRNN
jgi:hypothetical protein